MASKTFPVAAANGDNTQSGRLTMTYMNTNALGMATVTIGTDPHIPTFTADGVTYQNPYINTIVFKEPIISGLIALSQSVENISMPHALFDVFADPVVHFGYFINNSQIRYNTARTFSYVQASTSNIGWCPTSPDYHFDTLEEFNAAFENGEIEPVFDSTFRWDVYINGAKDPALTCIPTYAEGTGLSTLLIKPKLWTAADDLDAEYPDPFTWDDTKGIFVVDESRWGVLKGQTIPLLENHVEQYLSISEEAAAGLNALEKIVHYGIDGITNHVKLVLQFYYEDEHASYSDAYLVEIPRDVDNLSDIYMIRYPNTKYNDPEYNIKVVLHLGAPPSFVDPDSDSFPGGRNSDDDDDGVYTNPTDNPDFTPYDGAGFDGNCVLTKTYKLDAATLQNIGTKLWTQSYFDVLKIQNNPIENIISVKAFPFEPTAAGTSQNIKVGDVDFQISGAKIPNCEKKAIGTYTYNGYHGNFLDFSPYTIIKAYLPYCGWIQMDASAIYKRELSFAYAIDYVTGDCLCIINADGMPFMNVKGNMGVDITLTASNCVQSQIKAASGAINSAAQTAGHLMSGDVGGAAVSAASGALSIAGMDFQTQRSGAPSPLCATFENHAIAVFVEHPLPSGATPSDGYKHLHGYPCHKYTALSSLNGFVQVDTRSDISNIPMTEEERKMLEDLLIEGVYIWTATEQTAWRQQYG